MIIEMLQYSWGQEEYKNVYLVKMTFILQKGVQIKTKIGVKNYKDIYEILHPNVR
jgi:hypothetical protein